MTKNLTEEEIRERVANLKKFYKSLTIYIAVNLGFILIWAMTGGGYFWPIWVIVGWGIGLATNAYFMGLCPISTEFLPFLTEEWEEQQVKKLLSKSKVKKDISIKKK